ncbi:MAG TPA: hypothetical protein VKS21_12960, partial [Spirochaetota bacterium]|nr:hypothetical protein [Spirochaetota bacterium]
SDPATGIDLLWPSYVDGTALDGMSAQTVTNINYPAQQITVNQGGFNSWDYYLIQAVNYAPVSMGISNNTAMAYFDIAADGQDTGMEAVNDITLYFDGNAPDVSGIIQVYRDAGDKTNFSSVIDAELAAQAFNNTAGTVNITVNDQNQSQNQLDPTRYWISVTVTNDTPAVYDDRLNIKISNINVSGPNSGTLVSSNFLETMADKTARIDTHIIYVNFFNEVFSSVPQGEFNKLDFRMEISNSDPDTTNYLSSICISNRGSAVSSDLGYLKIFQDNGNGSFSINEDDGVSAGELSTNKIFTVSIYPPLPLSGTDNKVFWGAFDVDQLATVGATVELVAVNDNCLTFFDYHNDHVDPLPQVAELQSYPLPASPFAAKIILAGEKPYDFWLQRVDRRTPEIALPGIEVPLLSFDISREGKIATNQEWINSILVTNLYSGTNYSGYLKVYTNNQFEVDFRNSTPVSSNFLINNSNNYIEIVFSNTNIITTEPDLTRYFITYRPLAFAAKAVNDFRVASLGCGGPDNGAITNAAMLFSEDNAYPLAHHSNLVTINFTPVITSNSIVTQGDSNVLAARISIIPADSDAGWQLDHLNFTLSGSSWNAADIKNGRIYLDNGGTAGSWDNSDTLLDTESFETDGSFSPGFDPPLFITNQKNLLLLLNIDPAAHT